MQPRIINKRGNRRGGGRSNLFAVELNDLVSSGVEGILSGKNHLVRGTGVKEEKEGGGPREG